MQPLWLWIDLMHRVEGHICTLTKHTFSCFCSQCDPWKARFTYSHILLSINSPGHFYKFREKRWFQFFLQSLSHSWNPFKDVEKQCHGRPAIGGHLTNQFCQRGGSQGQDFQHISQNQILSFLKTFVGLHFKNQFYQEGKWEFQHFSQNRLMSWKEPRYKWNCLCISVWQNKFTMNVEDMGKICQNFSQFLMIVFNLLCI